MAAKAVWGIIALALLVSLGWRVSETKKKQASLDEVVRTRMAKLATAEAAEPASPAAPAAAPTTHVEPPPPSPLPRKAGALYFSGELRPHAEADLAFAVPGRLGRILVSQGEWVKEGQALLQLEDKEAQAHLKQARAAVEAAKAQASMAADAQKRVESLGTSNALSEQQRFTVGDQARLAHAGLMQAEAALELAELNVQNHTLRAPFGGRITRVPSGVGGIQGAGMPIVSIVDSSRWKVIATTSLEDGGRLHLGDAIEFTSPGLKEGVVRHISPVLQDRSRRVQIEIAAIPLDGATLFGGQVVTGLVHPKGNAK